MPALTPSTQGSRGGASARLRLAFLSHTAMGGPFVVGSHHLAASLAASGCDVMHVSAPVSIAHLVQARDPFVRARLRRWLRGGKELKGVKDIVPFTALPWALARTCGTLRKGYLGLMLASPTRSVDSLKLESADAWVIDEPRFSGLARRPANQVIVYRATDLYALMRNDPSIVEAERALCDQADVLVGTSDAVANHLRRISGKPVHVIGNGVEFAHFSTPKRGVPARTLPGERRQRAIYVGSFDSRFCPEAVGAASHALPDRHFILVGPGSEKAASGLARPNVTALGPVNYAELPHLLHQCSVGLLPLSADASNSGRSPMKLFEYAAAGLAVAATSALPLKSGAMPALSTADDDTGFSAAVAEAFACSADPATMRDASNRAQREDWSAKAEELRGLIEEAAVARQAATGASARGTGTARDARAARFKDRSGRSQWN